MTWRKSLITSLATIVLAAGITHAADSSSSEEAANQAELQKFLSNFQWFKGPGTATMDSLAEIQLPPGYMFTDGDATRTILEAMENLTDGSEMGFLSPTNLDWFVVFSFREDGYIKDDDKDELDPTAMLKVIRKGNDYANEQKKDLGMAPLEIVGWEKPPSYDAETQNLEWAIRAESEGYQIINYNTRILGRRGVMEIQLVVDPEQMAATLPTFKNLMAGFTYQAGNKYSEFQPGDKVAKYGLAALVTGAGVAVAAKTGLLAWIALTFKKAWKLIVVAAVAVAAFFKRIIFGRSAPRETAEPQG